MKKVIAGNDNIGISQEINWTGGGALKYYHLGPSIICINENRGGDFNWDLGRAFIEESLLQSYDYRLDKDFDLGDWELYGKGSDAPKVGIQEIGSRKRAAVVTLNGPGENRDMLSHEEVLRIYNRIQKAWEPDFINIFTNRGVELAYESKPEDLEIIKVPHAIFAELE